jgi:hypothetical protein
VIAAAVIATIFGRMKNQRGKQKGRESAENSGKSLQELYAELLRLRKIVRQAERKSCLPSTRKSGARGSKAENA